MHVHVRYVCVFNLFCVCVCVRVRAVGRMSTLSPGPELNSPVLRNLNCESTAAIPATTDTTIMCTVVSNITPYDKVMFQHQKW